MILTARKEHEIHSRRVFITPLLSVPICHFANFGVFLGSLAPLPRTALAALRHELCVRSWMSRLLGTLAMPAPLALDPICAHLSKSAATPDFLCGLRALCGESAKLVSSKSADTPPFALRSCNRSCH